MALRYTLTPDRPAQLGLVVLQTDESIERDMRHLLPADAELLVSRVPFNDTLDQASISEMEGRLTSAAALFPTGINFAAMGYGCTSATAQIGAEKVAALLRAGSAAAHVTEPVSALIAACRALGISRIGLISPYVAAVSDRLRHVLSEAGVAVTHFDSFNEPVEANVVRISEAALQDAALDMGQHDDVDAVFLSCTNLRTLGIIDAIEDALQKPVLASNQVLAWDLLRRADIAAPADNPGRLWRV